MSEEAYELLALLMRYVFALIGGLIVFRSYIWLRRDAKTYKKEMKALPDAGLVGEIVDMDTGFAQPLPREGTIGASRECDIRVKGRNVFRTHARFEFEPGKGLKIIPRRRAMTVMSGVELRGPAYALHGTQLMIGDHTLRVRLFAGLNIPTPAAYAEPDEILDAAEKAVPWADMMVDNTPFLPENEEADAIPFRSDTYLPPDSGQEYDGNYTDDGQMTWQYAYSLDELRQAQQREAEEAASPRRHRRRARRE